MARRFRDEHIAALRKVRTREGSQRYNLPIGATIAPAPKVRTERPAIHEDVSAAAPVVRKDVPKPKAAKKKAAKPAQKKVAPVAVKDDEPTAPRQAAPPPPPPDEPPAPPVLEEPDPDDGDDASGRHGLEPTEWAAFHHDAASAVAYYENFSDDDVRDHVWNALNDNTDIAELSDEQVEKLIDQAMSRKGDHDAPQWPGGPVGRVSRDQFDSAAGEWESQLFYSGIRQWRADAKRIQQDGYDPDSADDPVVGPLVSAVAHHPPTDQALFRGVQMAPEQAAKLVKDVEIDIPISGWTPDTTTAEDFARDPSLGGWNEGVKAHLPKEGQPVIFNLKPGARAVSLGNEASEHVTFGRFRVISEPRNLAGVTVVEIEQVSPLEKD